MYFELLAEIAVDLDFPAEISVDLKWQKMRRCQALS